jgi:hypothetical protein
VLDNQEAGAELVEVLSFDKLWTRAVQVFRF